LTLKLNETNSVFGPFIGNGMEFSGYIFCVVFRKFSHFYNRFRYSFIFQDTEKVFAFFTIGLVIHLLFKVPGGATRPLTRDGCLRNSAVTQQSGHAQRSKMEEVVPKMTRRRLRCWTIQN